ncbi:hypothetical protein J7384_18900 [Endozoicomonas sp. G2_1]|uniref:hypothetical protein n=1 Tax=Endozoicomonas sp. G2_1 TaxID=2821091 RepID=UPI001ADD5A00|nr:hypothetical protein [Endozoicomonas sp. G2_1]MBO9492438.1 hypothetical protein [Endozoicomonas sp. G2_1]
MELNILYFILILWIALNIIASFVVAKRDDLESFQKYGQVLLVWLIPYIASIGLLVFYRNNDKGSYLKKIGNSAKDDQAYFSNNNQGEP